MRVAPPEFHEARQQGVREDLQRAGLEALVVTAPPNVAYLTGLFASSAVAVIAIKDLHLIVDGRYLDVARARAADVPGVTTVCIPTGGSLLESTVAILGTHGYGRVGVEASHMSIRQHADLRNRLGSRSELVATDDVVEHRRAVKDSWELQVLRDAGRRLSDAAKCIIPKALAGSDERHLAAIIEGELRRVGFHKPAFDTIVASGPNSAMPHYRAGNRRLEPGDLVVLDFGGILDGYAVDMTRTVVIGRATARQLYVVEHVAAAQLAAFAEVKPERPASDVDAAARGVLERGGCGEAFSHGTGHGLGLEVHEKPRVSRYRADSPVERLKAGMVFTIEPGAYFPGWGGVRIEDDVAVTPEGAEWLTEAEGA